MDRFTLEEIKETYYHTEMNRVCINCFWSLPGMGPGISYEWCGYHEKVVDPQLPACDCFVNPCAQYMLASKYSEQQARNE